MSSRADHPDSPVGNGGSEESVERPRLLVLLNKSPVPDRTGSRRRNLRLLTAARHHFDVRVVVATSVLSSEDRSELATSIETGDLPPTDVVELQPVELSPVTRLRALVDRSTTYGERCLDHQSARRRVAQIVSSFEPDVIWSSNAISGHLLIPPSSVPMVVDAAHFESEWLRGQFRRTIVSVRTDRAMLRSNARLLVDRPSRVRAEIEAFQAATVVTACSEIEARVAGRLTSAPVVTVRNGVDLPSTLGWRPESMRLLFIGNFGYHPNAEAANELAKTILPLIRRRVPSAALDLVGQEPQRIGQLADLPGVTLHGFADDLAEMYRHAALVVAPIRSGSGTKSKVLESFAHGVPVVTTPVGIEGIDVDVARDVKVATSSADLATLAVDLLTDPASARRQRDAARLWIENGSDWSLIGEEFCQTLHSAFTRN